ncbi:hypothetical protein [Nocardia barduliensis]|uniref:hypothetical protein n=1 Tax=Nocardia barduliensis TaxID=2736643 RepID=UPI001572CA33|nr:hypothetical protein [Nocardia barduliensis]
MNEAARDPLAEQLRELTDRATRAGYRLVRAPAAPYDWELLDAEDGDVVVSATNLAQIEQWLDS